jgi:hypothetical protein
VRLRIERGLPLTVLKKISSERDRVVLALNRGQIHANRLTRIDALGLHVCDSEHREDFARQIAAKFFVNITNLDDDGRGFSTLT